MHTLLSGLWAASLLLLVTSRASPIDEWSETVAKATSHDHWEHLVRRSAKSAEAEGIEDDTSHIQDVQEYYRNVFASDSNWDSATPLRLSSAAEVHNLRIMQSLEAYLQAKNDQEMAKVEAADQSLVPDQSQQKKIKGRYIVTLSSESSDEVLDRTLSIMKYATSASQQRLRADHITVFRRAGKGFTGTLSSKMVELVSPGPSQQVVCFSFLRFDNYNIPLRIHHAYMNFHREVYLKINTYHILIYITHTHNTTTTTTTTTNLCVNAFPYI